MCINYFRFIHGVLVIIPLFPKNVAAFTYNSFRVYFSNGCVNIYLKHNLKEKKDWLLIGVLLEQITEGFLYVSQSSSSSDRDCALNAEVELRMFRRLTCVLAILFFGKTLI